MVVYHVGCLLLLLSFLPEAFSALLWSRSEERLCFPANILKWLNCTYYAVAVMPGKVHLYGFEKQIHSG